MSLTRRHSLHLQTLRTAQVLAHRRLQLIEFRQRAYDLRDRRDAEFQRRIDVARSKLEREAIEAVQSDTYAAIKVVIDRYNFGPVDVIEGGRPPTSEQLQAVLIYLAFVAAVASAEIATAEILLVALTADLELDPHPPGLTLRQTPRRPGAPSSAPALINRFLDQCGSAHAAPEIRLR